MAKRQSSNPEPLKPSLFIGSSSEGLAWAEAAQEELSRTAEVVRWDQGNFKPGWNTLASLIEIGKRYDFAMLIATGDDVVTSRGRRSKAVRDNILFEYGLLIGLLSPDRVFYLYDEDAKPRIPSDLSGQTFIPFKRLRSPSIWGDRDRAALGPACSQVRKAIERKGRRFHWLNPDKPISEELPAEVLALKLMEQDDPRYARPLSSRAPTVLLIEDSFISVSHMATLLYMYDIKVIACYDGLLGLRMGQCLEPDAIVIDYQLPNMNGREVCRRLKSSDATRRIPIIMLSGYSDAADEVASLEAGADDFMGKPCDTRVLVQRLCKLWGRTRP